MIQIKVAAFIKYLFERQVVTTLQSFRTLDMNEFELHGELLAGKMLLENRLKIQTSKIKEFMIQTSKIKDSLSLFIQYRDENTFRFGDTSKMPSRRKQI